MINLLQTNCWEKTYQMHTITKIEIIRKIACFHSLIMKALIIEVSCIITEGTEFYCPE